MVGLAAAVFLAREFLFPPDDHAGAGAATIARGRRRIIGQCLPQATVLASLTLLLQMVVAPLLLMSTVLLCLLYANNRKFLLLNEPLTPSDIVLTMRQIHSWPLLARYVRRSRRHDLGLAGGIGGERRRVGVRAVAVGAILVLAGGCFRPCRWRSSSRRCGASR